MVSLVACMSSGRDSWVPVIQLMSATDWDAIYLVMPSFFADKYSENSSKVHKIIIDENKELVLLTEDLVKAFDGKLFGDVAVNLSSGFGKEHMAVLAALLKSGCGIRLVSFDGSKIVEL